LSNLGSEFEVDRVQALEAHGRSTSHGVVSLDIAYSGKGPCHERDESAAHDESRLIGRHYIFCIRVGRFRRGPYAWYLFEAKATWLGRDEDEMKIESTKSAYFPQTPHSLCCELKEKDLYDAACFGSQPMPLPFLFPLPMPNDHPSLLFEVQYGPDGKSCSIKTGDPSIQSQS